MKSIIKQQLKILFITTLPLVVLAIFVINPNMDLHVRKLGASLLNNVARAEK